MLKWWSWIKGTLTIWDMTCTSSFRSAFMLKFVICDIIRCLLFAHVFPSNPPLFPNLMAEILRPNQQREGPPLARLSWCWWINDSYSESLKASFLSFQSSARSPTEQSAWCRHGQTCTSNAVVSGFGQDPIGHHVNVEKFLLIGSNIWLVRFGIALQLICCHSHSGEFFNLRTF